MAVPALGWTLGRLSARVKQLVNLEAFHYFHGKEMTMKVDLKTYIPLENHRAFMHTFGVNMGYEYQRVLPSSWTFDVEF